MKVTIAKLEQPKPGRRGKRSRVAIAEDGSKVYVRIVDGDSPTFGDDFLAAFQANVRSIRANQRKTSPTS